MPNRCSNQKKYKTGQETMMRTYKSRSTDVQDSYSSNSRQFRACRQQPIGFPLLLQQPVTVTGMLLFATPSPRVSEAMRVSLRGMRKLLMRRTRKANSKFFIYK